MTITGRVAFQRRRILKLGVGSAAALPLFYIGKPALAADQAAVIATSKTIVDAAASTKYAWDGPTTGPKAKPNQRVILVSEDQRNGGALGVSQGAAEAAKVIGWNLSIIDGAGVIAQRSAAFAEAIALKPDIIIVDNDDYAEQHVNLEKAAKAGIKLIGWHSTIRPGPWGALFTNISTDPLAVAKAASALAIVRSNGTAKAVVFTDSTEKISVLKSNAMAADLKACPGCEVLTIVDTPIAQVGTRIPGITRSLVNRFGKDWTYSLGINDGFYDFMGPTFRALGIPGSGPPVNIAGGDGSRAAFQRIRTGQYQYATVAEPLHLQAWQAIDEANRAVSGVPWSGFVTRPHLVVKSDIDAEGGKNDVFDPDNGYQEIYRKIWGV